MPIVLFDNKDRKQFFPLAATKAIAGLRMGVLTIQERWKLVTGQKVYIHTENYLMPLYETIPLEEHIWIDSTVQITDELLLDIQNLQLNEAIVDEKGLVAGKSNQPANVFDINNTLHWFAVKTKQVQVKRLEHAHQIFQWNDGFIRADFALLTTNRTSQPLPLSNQVINPDQVFLEEGVTMECCTLNASSGPIYIGKNASLMEGCLIRGPFVLGENSLLKMGSKIYGATTLGPNCVGGGEIKNVVMQGNSNKAHDGYLGDSVIGEWCNFGAGSSNSNIKNTGGEVHIWNFAANGYIEAGQKCGLLMGDYSRSAINSCINTGSVIGVCCNVFEAGLVPKFINHFSWGVKDKYLFEKALIDIANWKKMKHQALGDTEIEVLKYIFDEIGE
ncbi:putative sugar nucleotidyl transferase [Parasediminibacterium sp. JCM 36343]|uniref:putative sugar nucleotidyl transferase n=1 Tax=Parasediminibacterium sp. JCM 36343 TaxID=3374279 RepID=UPI00397BF5BA